MGSHNIGFFLAVVFHALFIFCLPFVVSQCQKKPVIFNFGDSNSDTGGFSAATGFEFGYPDGRAFFQKPTGRLCDGRLVIDFLCEHLKANYLTPYLESVGPDFTNGANFAVGGSATHPKHVPFSLDIQLLEFLRFYNRSLEMHSKGIKDLVDEKGFKNALYMIDIGQNDLSAAFNSLSYAQVIEKIPSFISEIKSAISAMYERGAMYFWVHNTGPLGCLPAKLATSKTNATDFDKHGCIEQMNEGAKAFNAELAALCKQLRSQMQNATIVYVDVYSIKYNLIENSAFYGFKHPLESCCGHGGPPYNYNSNVKCRTKGYNVCKPSSMHIFWDGVHYTQAANALIAHHILSTKYSTPPLGFSFFCNN
ncbi:GDSL-like Lipase/Acylhydrolase superfamily protein [Striga asiatica]|uniref:GDSL-like Lipase/Acylhydrolase superfamily protein n=1 Tax=Striga asiatica TaxID=4170 RepID=A0A5A7RC01_STRAF|nr:GDSL-like Lipase/Acylhydrolase superfamily protein [Striga asiatica]